MTWLPALLSAGILIGYAGLTEAGPPLVIDDPGILDCGQWEIIVAGSTVGTDNVDVYEIVLDVSVGLSANTQLSVAVPYVEANPAGDTSTRDISNPSVGFKWRFVNTDNLQVAFAPAYAFGITLSAALRGVGDTGNILFLPVNFEYALGNWTLNGEFGYVATEADFDGYAYGAAIGHPVGSKA